MDRGIRRDERNLVVTESFWWRIQRIQCVFFLEPKCASQCHPPPQKEGDYYLLTTMLPIVRPYIGGLPLDSESDVAAPFPALEKMNFLRVLFRYGVLKKKRVLLPQFCWKASSNCGIQYTPHGVGITACFNCRMMTSGGGGTPKKHWYIYIYIYKFCGLRLGVQPYVGSKSCKKCPLKQLVFA